MKVKIKQNNHKANLDSAQYTLTFKSKDKEANYRILSALVQEDDLLIEIDSSWFSNNKKEIYFKEILQYIRTNDLDYNYNKITNNDIQSIFGNLYNKNTVVHKTIFYLPNNIWKSESFRSIIPINGARYYILNKNNDEKILKYMGKMMDNEILDYFKLIVYDPGCDNFQQM